MKSFTRIGFILVVALLATLTIANPLAIPDEVACDECKGKGVA